MHWAQVTMGGHVLTCVTMTGLNRHDIDVVDTHLSALIGAWPPAPPRLPGVQPLWCSAILPRTASTSIISVCSGDLNAVAPLGGAVVRSGAATMRDAILTFRILIISLDKSGRELP
eukprot:4266824-Pleurochrysis_carterae.AAC.1